MALRRTSKLIRPLAACRPNPITPPVRSLCTKADNINNQAINNNQNLNFTAYQYKPTEELSAPLQVCGSQNKSVNYDNVSQINSYYTMFNYEFNLFTNFHQLSHISIYETIYKEIQQRFREGRYEECLKIYHDNKDTLNKPEFEIPKMMFQYLLESCLRVNNTNETGPIISEIVLDVIKSHHREDPTITYLILSIYSSQSRYISIIDYYINNIDLFRDNFLNYVDICKILHNSFSCSKNIELLTQLYSIMSRSDIIEINEYYIQLLCENNESIDIINSEYEQHKMSISTVETYEILLDYYMNKQHQYCYVFIIYNNMILNNNIIPSYKIYKYLYECSAKLNYYESNTLVSIYNNILKNEYLPVDLYIEIVDYFKNIKLYNEIFNLFEYLLIFNSSEYLMSYIMHTLLSISKQFKYYEKCLKCYEDYTTYNYIINGNILTAFTNYCKYSNNSDKLLLLYNRINDDSNNNMNILYDSKFYYAMIHLALDYKDYKQIERYITEINKKKISMTSEIYSVLFNYVKVTNNNKKFKDLIIEIDINPNLYLINTIVYTSLLDCCRIFQLYDLGMKYYYQYLSKIDSKEFTPNKSLYITMMSIFKAMNLWEEALYLFNRMKELEGPNNTIYSSMIAFCKESGNAEYAKDLYIELLNNNIQPSSSLCSSLLNTYKECKMYKDAEELYNDIINVKHIKGSSTFHATMITIYGDENKFETAWELYNNLVDKHVDIGNSIYCSLLHICEITKDYDKANDLYKIIINNSQNNSKFEPNTHVYSSFMSVCLITNHISRIYELIEDMKVFKVENDNYVNDVLEKCKITF